VAIPVKKPVMHEKLYDVIKKLYSLDLLLL